MQGMVEGAPYSPAAIPVSTLRELVTERIDK